MQRLRLETHGCLPLLGKLGGNLRIAVVEHRRGWLRGRGEIFVRPPFNGAAALVQQRFFLVLVPELRPDQVVAQPRHRLGGPMTADLGIVAIAAGIVGGRVVGETIGDGFDQGTGRAPAARAPAPVPLRTDRDRHHCHPPARPGCRRRWPFAQASWRRGLLCHAAPKSPSRCCSRRKRPGPARPRPCSGLRRRHLLRSRRRRRRIRRRAVLSRSRKASATPTACGACEPTGTQLGKSSRGPGEIVAALVAAPIEKQFLQRHPTPELSAMLAKARQQHIARPHGGGQPTATAS